MKHPRTGMLAPMARAGWGSAIGGDSGLLLPDRAGKAA